MQLHPAFAISAILLLASAREGEAKAADFNIPVAARIVSFQQPVPTHDIAAAIIYDPSDPASTSEASSIEKQVGNGVAAGKAVVHVRRIPVNQLPNLPGNQVAFVTSGLRAHYGEIAAAAQKNGVLTITSDLGCVTAERCAVAVISGAKVQITVSRAASKAARVQFGSAFLMLVKEL